jgi:carbon-monoxide dehydrogenase large subunit
MATAQRYVGGGVLRKEDPELLTGQAHFIDDITAPGMAWMFVVRSPFAHAKIRSVETSSAGAMPGVIAVWSGKDLADEWQGSLPCAWPVTEDIQMPTHWPVAQDEVRHQGEAVAVVVAETRAQAKDAAEAVSVDYDPMPVVTDAEQALKSGAPLVHADLDTNRSYTWTLSAGEVDKVFAEAPVIVKERYYHPRLIPNAIEPRGAMAVPSPAQGEFTLYSATQIPHILKTALTAFTIANLPESKLRVIAPDVGGGFGSKLNVYAEEAVLLAAARRTGRPIKWIEERTENYLSTIQGRDVYQDVELAASDDGKLLGVRAHLVADMGAYLQLVTPGIPLLGAFLYHGVYQPLAYDFACTGVFTNKTPTDAYRGAGRPEATYAIERAMDALARRVGKDPAALRRMNFMAPFTEPTDVISGLKYDSGDYAKQLDRALEISEYEQLRKEQQARRDAGDVRQLGIGLSTYIEMCGLAPSQVLAALRYVAGGWDAATIRCLPTGAVVVVTGTSPHGQGHVTSWAQIVADALGVSMDDVEVLHGDTAVSPLGMDTYGSRSLAVGGVALHFAAKKIVEKARTIAAHELEVSEDDLAYEAGTFSVKGAPDRARTIPQIAFSAWTAHNLPPDTEPGLEATHVYDPGNFTFPAGAHVCVVEVDTETGEVSIEKYVAVDDCGTVINPMIVEGQVHGGITQGIAEALFEEGVYDDDGNLLTSSMTNYLVPSAAELPTYELDRTVTPSSTNPMGVKGIGEAGTIAAPPAVVNAVIDAVSHLGVTHIEKPVTPERVWRAIRQARGDGKGGAA